MKRNQKLSWLMTGLLFFSSITTSFSQTAKEFFNNTSIPLTYLGIDFYQSRLINDPNANPSDIKGRLFGSMNDVVVTEAKNYDIAGAFHRTVTSDLTAITERNEKVDANKIKSTNTSDFNRLTEADIAAEIKALSLNKDGYGLVFIMEGMKKEEKKSYGSVWVVLIDMKTKKVLMAERMEQEATGIGFRNFWVSIVKKTITEVDKKKEKAWKDKYGS
jgi:ATP-dependent helicase YprA (DUF1998 family)